MRIATGFLILILLAATPAGAANITVTTLDGGGLTVDGNCSLAEATISARFNVAADACTAGSPTGFDIILFAANLFPPPLGIGTINLQQSLAIDGNSTVIEAPPGASLVIAGSGSDPIFRVQMAGSASFILRRLTLTGGDNSDPGGAIEVIDSDGSSIELDRVNVLNSSSGSYGGAIGGVVNGHLFIGIRDSTLSDNQAAEGGALGVAVAGGASAVVVVTVEDSGFSANSANNGGAIALRPGGLGGGAELLLNVLDSRFDDNEASLAGGAIFLTEQAPEHYVAASILRSRFSLNEAGRGGAVFVDAMVNEPGSLELRRSSFEGNVGSLDGGAVLVQFAATRIANSLFVDNSSGGGAGAIRLEHDDVLSAATVQVYANSFLGNTGSPKALRLHFPDASQSGATTSFFANVVGTASGMGASCDIANSPGANFNAATTDAAECAIGGNFVTAADLGVAAAPLVHPVHEIAAVPQAASPLVDAWPEANCSDGGGSALPLEFDMLGARRDAGEPLDGDGDGTGDCDIGAFERPAAGPPAGEAIFADGFEAQP